LKVGERLSRERAEAMDKKESLKLYVLGTMLVTLWAKEVSAQRISPVETGRELGQGCREEFAAVW
jgi:hypothetical protein